MLTISLNKSAPGTLVKHIKNKIKRRFNIEKVTSTFSKC
jgi:hypothetical protein